MAKQYNYQDDFEMLFFRHEYLTKLKNPNPQWIEDFKGVIKVTSAMMYNKYSTNFIRVGVDEDDINGLAQMFTLYYMELYSVRKSEETLNKFIDKYTAREGRAPTEDEINSSEKNHLINFLRQKIKHADTVCSRKARNIICSRSVSVVLARTAETTKASEEEILADHKKFGYRKVTQKELKEIEKNSQHNNLTDKDGYHVVKITRHADNMSKTDYDLIMHDNVNIYSSSPEDNLAEQDNIQELSMYREKFAEMSLKERKRILNRFIKQNRGKKRMKVEMKAAKALLESAKNVV